MNREALIDLNDILQHPGRKLDIDLGVSLPVEPGLELVEPITGKLQALSTGNALLLQGTCTAKYIAECSRCTYPLEKEVTFDFDEQFDVVGIPSSYGSGDHARMASDEPYPLFHENSLILDAFIRQVFIVNLPVQNLCSFGWDDECPNANKIASSNIETKSGSLSEKLSALLQPEAEQSTEN